MREFTIQFLGRENMEVHKAGCKDLAKHVVGESRENVTAATAVDAARSVLGDEQDESTLAGMGYTTSDFRFLPCSH